MKKMDAVCVICKKSIGDKSKASVLRVKGCEGFNEAAKQRNEQTEASAGDTVQKEYRKNYTNPKIIKHDLREGDSDDLCTTSRGRRSLGSQFSFAKDCLFCGRPAKFDGKKKGYDAYPVRTFGFQEKISEICEKKEMTGPTKLKEDKNVVTIFMPLMQYTINNVMSISNKDIIRASQKLSYVMIS